MCSVSHYYYIGTLFARRGNLYVTSQRISRSG
nr:MAG TPA: II Vacuolar protein sorting protein 36 Vps36 [Caudoviricetes sp.]